MKNILSIDLDVKNITTNTSVLMDDNPFMSKVEEADMKKYIRMNDINIGKSRVPKWLFIVAVIFIVISLFVFFLSFATLLQGYSSTFKDDNQKHYYIMLLINSIILFIPSIIVIAFDEKQRKNSKKKLENEDKEIRDELKNKLNIPKNIDTIDLFIYFHGKNCNKYDVGPYYVFLINDNLIITDLGFVYTIPKSDIESIEEYKQKICFSSLKRELDLKTANLKFNNNLEFESTLNYKVNIKSGKDSLELLIPSYSINKFLEYSKTELKK